jgi:hypothetical protein
VDPLVTEASSPGAYPLAFQLRVSVVPPAAIEVVLPAAS